MTVRATRADAAGPGRGHRDRRDRLLSSWRVSRSGVQAGAESHSGGVRGCRARSPRDRRVLLLQRRSQRGVAVGRGAGHAPIAHGDDAMGWRRRWLLRGGCQRGGLDRRGPGGLCRGVPLAGAGPVWAVRAGGWHPHRFGRTILFDALRCADAAAAVCDAGAALHARAWRSAGGIACDCARLLSPSGRPVPQRIAASRGVASGLCFRSAALSVCGCAFGRVEIVFDRARRRK